MADVYRVIDVEDRTDHNSPHWHVLMERDSDGLRRAYIFPNHIFEVRAGEYGIPHEDFETLLDIVLHEPHIPAPMKQGAKDAAALKGMVTKGINGSDEPIWLYNSPTTAQARSAHLARVAHAKENTARVETAPGDILDVIRNSYDPSPEAVEAMAEHVKKVRRAIDSHNRRMLAAKTAEQPKRRPSPLEDFFSKRRTG